MFTQTVRVHTHNQTPWNHAESQGITQNHTDPAKLSAHRETADFQNWTVVMLTPPGVRHYIGVRGACLRQCLPRGLSARAISTGRRVGEKGLEECTIIPANTVIRVATPTLIPAT